MTSAQHDSDPLVEVHYIDAVGRNLLSGRPSAYWWQATTDSMASSARSLGQQKLESMWKLGGLTVWQLTRKVVHGTVECDLFGRASELAFNFLLALFPLLLFMLVLFSLFTSHTSQLENSLLSSVSHFLPPVAFRLLSEVTNELGKNAARGKLPFDIVLGIVVALWFGSEGTSAMIFTLNAAYRVRESRSWLTVRLIALGLTVAISVLVLTALSILLLGGNVVDWIGSQFHLRSIVILLWKVLQFAAAMLFVSLSFSLIYSCGPTMRKRRWYWSTPGSTVGTLLWLGASVGFRIYLHFLNTYAATYASLQAGMILLVWLYVTGLAFLVGGEINAEIERVLPQQ